ncbi:MAG: hypothetical protein ACFFAS_01125 [Promethearchaeota archaeon]
MPVYKDEKQFLSLNFHNEAEIKKGEERFGKLQVLREKVEADPNNDDLLFELGFLYLYVYQEF